MNTILKRNELLNNLRGTNSKVAKRIPAVKAAREALSGLYNASQSRALTEEESTVARRHISELHAAMVEHYGQPLLNH